MSAAGGVALHAARVGRGPDASGRGIAAHRRDPTERPVARRGPRRGRAARVRRSPRRRAGLRRPRRPGSTCAARTSPPAPWCAATARRSPAARCSRPRSCAAARAAATAPADRRRACRAPSRPDRRAARAWASASCAGAPRRAGPTGAPASSHVICSRVPRQKPSSGIVGEDCSQPPEGVTAIMLPQRSTTSMWHVSPRVSPARRPSARPCPRQPAASVRSGGRNGARPGSAPGRHSRDAVSPIWARRVTAYSSDSSSVERHIAVAVVRVAVGEGELERLEDRVGARFGGRVECSSARRRGCAASAAARGPASTHRPSRWCGRGTRSVDGGLVPRVERGEVLRR